MNSALTGIMRLTDLRSKIVITILLLVLCRVGGFIPIPGINGEYAVNYFRSMTGGGQNLFQLVDSFTGGAFSQMNVNALGVMPYISASIILQIVVALIPSFQREMKENQEAAKRKLGRYTRLLTLVLSFMQALFFANFALRIGLESPGVIASEVLTFTLFGAPVLFYALVVMGMTTGTLFLMWVGERITEYGIGNGISMIISLNILSQLPTAIGLIVQQLNLDSPEFGQMSFSSVAVLIGIFVAVSWGTILIVQGHRRIPLQYARRVVGRREVQGNASYLPLKVNYAGVIPVIFASAFLMFPATIGQLLPGSSWIYSVTEYLTPGTPFYLCLYVLLIIACTYFWTSTQFKPDQIASDMKRTGAFIPGIRQGKATQDYLESTMNRITFIGACSLALIAVLPTLFSRFLGIPHSISYFFGGTALLILVGVILDTMKQVESHLLMNRYDGFMKKSRY